MKAMRSGGDAHASTQKASSASESSATAVGLELSLVRDHLAAMPMASSITPLLDAVLGPLVDTPASGPDSAQPGEFSWEAMWGSPVQHSFSPTVGESQAEAYRSATDEEVNRMDPVAIREALLAEQAAKDAEPWVQAGGPRDLLDVARERQAIDQARHAPRGRQEGGHAWDIVEYAPKGRYAERLPEGHPGDNGSFRSGYQFMYDEAGNETGWTNCSTFTTDQVMADAGYNIDKQMTVNGVEASLTDFANNRLLHSNSADVDIRTLQGDLETPVFQTVDDYYDARAEDSVLTDGLAGALVNAVDEDGQALGQYLPNREGDRDHRQADLNFIRPGDALQTYKGRKEGGTRGHSVIVSQVVGRDKDGREVTLTGEEDPMILEGFVVTDVSYLSANADNQQGQVLTDVSKTVDEMYDEYTGLIAARPRYNDYGSIGFEQGEDGSYQEIEVGAETLQDAIPNPVHVDVDGQRVPQ